MAVRSPAKASKTGRSSSKAAIPRRAPAPERDADATVAEPVLLPLAAIALRLLAERGARDLVYIAADERRAETLGRLLTQLAPAVDTLVFPPWDCLPFDRASPSRESMGRRMAVLRRLGEARTADRIVVTSPEAVLQKLPPAHCAADVFTITVGNGLDLAALTEFAARAGYGTSDRVDEAGQFEIHGQVVEVFPPDAEQPFRIDLADGVVTSIAAFDPLSQRSRPATLERLVIGPATEFVFAPGKTVERVGGCEHRLPLHYDEPLLSLFEAIPDALLFAAPETEGRRRAFVAQLDEMQAARKAPEDRPDDRAVRPVPAWNRLYLDDEAWRAILDRHEERDIVGAFAGVPDFAGADKPAHAFGDFLQASLAAGTTVVLAGVPRDLSSFARFLERHGGAKPTRAVDWDVILKAARGAFFSLDLDLDEGVSDPTNALVLVAAADVLGTRAHRAQAGEADHRTLLQIPAMRIGDTVIHEDHGIGILRGLEQIEVNGQGEDAVRLEYHDGDSVLAPVSDLGKLWRYGSDDDVVALDRLHTDAWTKRRLDVIKSLIETGRHLVAVAAEREAAAAPRLVAPRRGYEAIAARFPFPETPDQTRAIAAVIADLAGGHPMDRLVCGDVGFGKTEVALRAAAVALLCGKQVALVAPTTVLARQHLHTVTKRFAGLGFAIAGLSRLDSPAEAKRVREGLADGSIAMVVGTHAVAGSGVAFADLGLLIIDEEQKFGAKLKAELRAKAVGGHVLTMTATPIPRTLQMAMVGIQAVSVIATPPVRRRPIRTLVSAFDAATVRIALMREHDRGGQSFVIVPRIEDIDVMRRRLAEIVPALSVLVAHGELPVEEADRAMVAFAGGRGDVLLATNIVESGLDVPRANTMLVWHADRFGLSQLHQLRGRVGRGRAQGVAYLLTNPNTVLSEATRARLSTLQAFDRLGAGFAISARDLDLRGAGDLVGDDQAGHLKLIGLGLYQSLLGRAVRQARGEVLTDDTPPAVHLGAVGRIPDSFVVEPDLRIDLYARLSRLETAKEILGFEEEIEDRFGPQPEPVKILFALARLRVLCRQPHVATLSAGPRAIAATLHPAGIAAGHAVAAARTDMALKGSRLVWDKAGDESGDFRRAEAFLEILAAAALRTPEAA